MHFDLGSTGLREHEVHDLPTHPETETHVENIELSRHASVVLLQNAQHRLDDCERSLPDTNVLEVDDQVEVFDLAWNPHVLVNVFLQSIPYHHENDRLHHMLCNLILVQPSIFQLHANQSRSIDDHVRSMTLVPAVLIDGTTQDDLFGHIRQSSWQMVLFPLQLLHQCLEASLVVELVSVQKPQDLLRVGSGGH